MLGEIFAYYYGKSVGRQGRKRKRKKMTADDLAAAELTAVIVVICLGMVAALVIFGGPLH